MSEIEITTHIAAPPEACFDLARNVAFHAESLEHTGERIVEAPARPLLKLGDDVEFEGRHFGVRQRFRARITAYDSPRWFRDEMVRGAFAAFVHDHLFEATETGTLMCDRIQFAAPFGLVGRLFEKAVLKRYLSRLIAERAAEIKRAAEG
ncbi:MAG: SRPBCC family protein [Bacteroidota bacterium]